jgi:hypothetical protein
MMALNSALLLKSESLIETRGDSSLWLRYTNESQLNVVFYDFFAGIG